MAVKLKEPIVHVESVDWNWVAQRAAEIYAPIKDKIEKEYRGKVCVIEVKSGDFFIGETGIEAVKKGREKHPDGIFFGYRIGYRFYGSYCGGRRKA